MVIFIMEKCLDFKLCEENTGKWNFLINKFFNNLHYIIYKLKVSGRLN